MRILGVDPGLTRCGVGIVDAAGGTTARLVHVEVLTTDSDSSIDQRLMRIADGLERLFDTHIPDVLAVERVFAQNNVSTVMGTAQAAGIAMLVAARRGVPVAMHTPSEVKAAVTGNGTADKKQVQNMVRRILRLQEVPKPADAADALALAICHLWRQGSGSLVTDVGGAMTPAQRLWAEAERAARRSANPRTKR